MGGIIPLTPGVVLGASSAQGQGRGFRACKQPLLLFWDPHLYCSPERCLVSLGPCAAPAGSIIGDGHLSPGKPMGAQRGLQGTTGSGNCPSSCSSLFQRSLLQDCSVTCCTWQAWPYQEQGARDRREGPHPFLRQGLCRPG